MKTVLVWGENFTITCCHSFLLIGARVRIMVVLMNNPLFGNEQSVQHITTLETGCQWALPHSIRWSSFTCPCHFLCWLLCVHKRLDAFSLFPEKKLDQQKCYSWVLINVGINAIPCEQFNVTRPVQSESFKITLQWKSTQSAYRKPISALLIPMLIFSLNQTINFKHSFYWK